jgi:hypothetical protein
MYHHILQLKYANKLLTLDKGYNGKYIGKMFCFAESNSKNDVYLMIITSLL